MHAGQLKLREVNHLTFLGTKYPKCKQEHGEHDSHCLSQQELDGLNENMEWGKQEPLIHP